MRDGPTGLDGIVAHVSDVIWAAGIAVGGSTAAGIIAFVGTRFAAVETTRREAQRLRSEHREEDRRARRDAYANFLMSLEELDTLTSAYTPDPTLTRWTDWLARHRAVGVSMRLVESTAVRDARREWMVVFDQLVPKVMAGIDQGLSVTDALGYPYVAMQGEFREVSRALADAMHADLGFDSPNDS